MASPNIYIKCINCTCISRAFKQLTREELTLIDANRTELNYRKGEILCKQGAFISNTFFMRKGLVKVYLENGNHPITISLEKMGSFLGVSSLVGSTVFQYSAEALTEVEVCQVDVNLIRKLLSVNSQFALKVLELSNKESINAYNRIYSLTQKQLNGRFAELLINLSENIYENDEFEFPVTKKQIAELVNSSPESISRLIKEFSKSNIVEINNQHFTIKDMDRLKLIMNTG